MTGASKSASRASGSNGQADTVKLAGLLGRLHAAQQAVVAPGKKGRNDQQKYDYVRAEDLISAARKALLDAGLVATMTYTGSESREVTSKSGGQGLYVMLSAALRIADPETGDSIEVPGFGAGIDYPGDKAVYKAQTGAAKYAFASALGMAMGDDPESGQGVPADAGTRSAPELNTIAADRVAHLMEAFQAIPRKGDDADAELKKLLKLKLGSIGVSATGVGAAFAKLTPGQADEIDTWISEQTNGGAK